jgi:uncharacterized protein (UPF0261 family)
LYVSKLIMKTLFYNDIQPNFDVGNVVVLMTVREVRGGLSRINLTNVLINLICILGYVDSKISCDANLVLLSLFMLFMLCLY